MDISKMPPPGPAPKRAGTTSSPDAGQRQAQDVAPTGDRTLIRPLDVAAALQILLAEVRASFQLTALSMAVEPGNFVDAPTATARAIVQMFLQAIPEDLPSVPLWNAAVGQAQISLQAGLERAIAAISAWRDVPLMVVNAAKETHALVATVLNEDLENPVWLRPEWAGLAPQLEKFRRRRRFARRHVSDPDYSQRKFEDDPEHRS